MAWLKYLFHKFSFLISNSDMNIFVASANEIECPEGTEFKECANACGSSCGALQSGFVCDEQCIPGCTCPDGNVSFF